MINESITSVKLERRRRQGRRRSERRFEREFLSFSKLAEHDPAIASYVIENKLSALLSELLGAVRLYEQNHKSPEVSDVTYANRFIYPARRLRELLTLITPAYTKFAEAWRLQHDELRKHGQGCQDAFTDCYSDSGHDAIVRIARLTASVWGEVDPSEPSAVKRVRKRLPEIHQLFVTRGWLLEKTAIKKLRNIARFECRQARVAAKKFGGDEEPKSPSLGLPVVELGSSFASITFRGESFQGVDLAAAEALEAICRSYPLPCGLTRRLGTKPKPIVNRLPTALRERVYSVPGNRGYGFRLTDEPPAKTSPNGL